MFECPTSHLSKTNELSEFKVKHHNFKNKLWKIQIFLTYNNNVFRNVNNSNISKCQHLNFQILKIQVFKFSKCQFLFFNFLGLNLLLGRTSFSANLFLGAYCSHQRICLSGKIALEGRQEEVQASKSDMKCRWEVFPARKSAWNIAGIRCSPERSAGLEGPWEGCHAG